MVKAGTVVGYYKQLPQEIAQVMGMASWWRCTELAGAVVQYRDDAAESWRFLRSSDLRHLQKQVAKLTSDVWYYQKKFDRLMNVTVHNEYQISLESVHNADLVKQMASLRKEYDEALKWKEDLILKQKEDISLVEKCLSAQEVIHKKYHADFEDAYASLDKVTAERNVLSSEIGSVENMYQVLSSENASLRIDVEDLRTEQDTLEEDLEAVEVDLAEARHSLEESLSHAGGLQEQLVGVNAKINRLEG
ncbi:uncharacterized protein LOC113355605 [Papaver somniferum]|uniref:uncharacterized protein LOC113355605 n=1 Tax=Papaver somniferum TaxID=3469 RepID=UPI000E702ACE|nr:uncharacterized protein LOC113355605 [Papaver somniferum]